MNNSNDRPESEDTGSAIMLTCQQLDSFMVDYVDETLGPKQRAAFEAHISACPPCVKYVEDYKSAIEMGQSAFNKESNECSDNIPEALVSAILKASKS